MEHIAALLLIVGCSSDLSECRELPAPIALYEAYEDCELERPGAFAKAQNKGGVIFARCVEVDPALENEDVELVWDVTAQGELVATIQSPELLMASDFRGREKFRQE